MTSVQSQEVAALDRVLMRLGLTEENKLEPVLLKLLPLVIRQLGTGAEGVRKKVLEILTHVNKRVKGNASIKLPLSDLLDAALAAASPPLVRNFAVVYSEMAFERADAAARLQAVPRLAAGISARSTQHRDIFLRLIVQALVQFPAKDTAADAAEQHPLGGDSADSTVLLGFFFRVLLYQLPVPPPSRSAQPGILNLLRPQQGLQQGPQVGIASLAGAMAGSQPAAAAQPSAPSAPAGLSKAEAAAVEGKKQPAEGDLAAWKQGIMKYLEQAPVAADRLVLHFLAAACDPRDAVSRLGDEALRRRCSLDSPKPTVDLEQQSLVDAMLRLFLGLPPEATALPAEARVQPAAPALRARLLGLLCKSRAAADTFPGALQVLEASLEPGQPLRLRQAGMQFAVWVFQQAPARQLLPRAPAVLARLLSLLQEDASGGDAASILLRGFAYQAIGQLAARAPQPFQEDTTIARAMFGALATEPPGVRASLQEAVSSLASAYKGCSGDAAHHIELLLFESMASPLDAARLCAAQWAERLFPFSHPPARYLACIACGDAKLEVREAGRAGLQPPTAGSSSSSSSSSVFGPLSEAKALEPYPDVADLVAFACSRHRRLSHPVQSTEQIVLPPSAYLALVGFLQKCRRGGGDADHAEYFGLLEHALVAEGSAALHVAALQSLLALAQPNAAAVQQQYSRRTGWLQSFLGHVDAAARGTAAKLLGIVSRQLPASNVQQLLSELAATADPSEAKAQRFELQHGSLSALGYVLAQNAAGQSAIDSAASHKAVDLLVASLGWKDQALAAAGALAIGHLGLQGPVLLSTPSEKRPQPDGPPPAAAAAAADAAAPMDVEREEAEPVAAASNTGCSAAAIERIAALLKSRDAQVVSSASTALGFLAMGDTGGAHLTQITAALVAVAGTKTESVMFAVGEALCLAFGGVALQPEDIVSKAYTSLADHVTALEGKEGHSNPSRPDASSISDMPIDRANGDVPTENRAKSHSNEAQSRASSQKQILDKILEDLVIHSRQEVRTAGCVWLTSLVSFTGRQALLLQRLAEVQEAFSSLLGDSVELTQELASRGLSKVYHLGDAAAQQALLQDRKSVV